MLHAKKASGFSKISKRDLVTWETLSLLANSSHNFYLTGSRFFGNARELSDWDFFSQYSEELEKWLLEQGFTHLLGSQNLYNDENTAMVLERGWIQVQLQAEVNLKIAAQTILDDLTGREREQFLNTTKLSKREYWNEAFILAKKLRNVFK